MVSGEADGSKRIVVNKGTLTLLESITSVAEVASATIAGLVDVVHRSYPFPPDTKKASKSKTGLADEGVEEFWQEAISTTKDVYLLGILHYAKGAVDFNKDHLDAINVIPQDTTDSEFFPWYQIKDRPFKYLNDYWIYGYRAFPVPLLLAEDHIFELEVWNCSGATLDLKFWVIYFEEPA